MPKGIEVLLAEAEVGSQDPQQSDEAIVSKILNVVSRKVYVG